MKSGEFKKGSMLPKVESCVDFCESTGGIGIITSLECALPALNNETGTIIRSSQKGGKKMAKTKKKKERNLKQKKPDAKQKNKQQRRKKKNKQILKNK